MRNASGRPGRIEGELLEIIEMPLGRPTPTIKQSDNFELTVIRIGANVVR